MCLVLVGTSPGHLLRGRLGHIFSWGASLRHFITGTSLPNYVLARLLLIPSGTGSERSHLNLDGGRHIGVIHSDGYSPPSDILLPVRSSHAVTSALPISKL
eukprot:3615949-Pyramimonas_sp.AAC.1